jgi:arginase family enzyme
MTPQPGIAFLGCPLDADERQAAVEEKRACLGAGQDDPYEAVVELVRAEVDPALWREAGRLEVPDWLRPIPPARESGAMVVDNFVHFIDQGGCRDFADSAGEMAAQAALPEVPALVGVDHSLAGGLIELLSRRLGPEALSVVVLDSHLDAITTPEVAGAIAYDLEHNPRSVYDPADPFLAHRPDAYHASSFLRHLLAAGRLLPRNLYVVGISDYPPKHAFRLKDPRIRRYTAAYQGLRRQGARLITKQDLAAGSGKLRALLKGIRTPWLYLSADLDIGAGSGAPAVRFDNWTGLNQAQIYRLGTELRRVLDSGVGLAGLDVSEFNPRRRDSLAATYRVAANLLRQVAFGLEPA